MILHTKDRHSRSGHASVYPGHVASSVRTAEDTDPVEYYMPKALGYVVQSTQYAGGHYAQNHRIRPVPQSTKTPNTWVHPTPHSGAPCRKYWS